MVRSGVAHAARLTPSETAGDLPSGAWRMNAGDSGTLEDLVVQSLPAVELAAGQVRVVVAAVGVNFRDVLVALGMYPGGGEIGVEGAGVITEVGPGVAGLAVGDAVMGLLGVVGSEAVVDAHLVTAVPAGWSLVQAAGVPVVFLTALYGLNVLAGLKAGERVLIHAATGGVGMAAVQLARHWGAEVFVTASRGKWDTLRAMGFDDDHIGDSRSAGVRGQIPGHDRRCRGWMWCWTRWPVSSSMRRCGCWSAVGALSRWADRPARPRTGGSRSSRRAVPCVRPHRGRP